MVGVDNLKAIDGPRALNYKQDAETLHLDKGAVVFAMATFEDLRRRTRQLAERMAKMTGVDESTAMNVLMYAKTLTPPNNPDVIDKVVFIAQLCTRFGMSSIFLINIIFESLKLKGCAYMKLEEYVRVICVFLTTDIEVKIDFVFRCYDIQRDGYLDFKEIYTLLTSSIILTSEEHDTEEQVKELIDLVMAMTDRNRDGKITPEEFSAYVHRDILFIELLGSVLPLESFVKEFMSLLQGKTPHNVSVFFAKERQLCLQEPPMPELGEKLYPVRLELP
ncbi:calcineurin B-like protein 1 [Elysia marginata]|uniref:Calcineurin B-like protein 1 n=1 Tax=Elysia marginata TaxID=1093978 RepID=A0AAV4IRW3_9GAST|nr:calcineurin B-like protein 1 [Elysia marginata]